MPVSIKVNSDQAGYATTQGVAAFQIPEYRRQLFEGVSHGDGVIGRAEVLDRTPEVVHCGREVVVVVVGEERSGQEGIEGLHCSSDADHHELAGLG